MVIFWDLFSVVLPVLGQFMSNMHGLCNRIYFQGKNAFMWLPWWSSGWDSELPVQGVHVQCMIRELRFCKPHSKAEEKKMHWDGAENWICNSVALRMKSACHTMVMVKKKKTATKTKKLDLWNCVKQENIKNVFSRYTSITKSILFSTWCLNFLVSASFHSPVKHSYIEDPREVGQLLKWLSNWKMQDVCTLVPFGTSIAYLKFQVFKMETATDVIYLSYCLGLQNHCRWWLQPWN